ncbi:MAG TPA: hypothetical protein VGD97_07955 [Lacunisphaera sp.]
MRLKIKWNDDRVRGATTAILLISRERLIRGEPLADMIQASLAEYRADPEGYKEKKRAWADVRESGPLTKPLHLAYYRNLIAAVDALLQKWTQSKRQFNSLLELDNALVENLRNLP